MRNTNQKLIIAFFSLALILAFQNCSPATFKATDGSAPNKALGGSGDGQPVDLPDNADDSPPEETADLDDEPVMPDDEAASLCEQFQAGAPIANIEIIETSIVELRNIRSPLRIHSADLVSLFNVRGPVLISTQDVGVLENLRGPLCLIGRKVDGKQGVGRFISNHRGRLEVSNIDLELINNTRGPLIIRGGTVKEIRNHRGPIQVVDGAKVESMINVQ